MDGRAFEVAQIEFITLVSHTPEGAPSRYEIPCRVAATRLAYERVL
jgi:hypothetical protein